MCQHMLSETLMEHRGSSVEWSAVQVSMLCLQALLLCISPVCTTPDLGLTLYLVVSAQFQAMGPGLLDVSSAVASCGQVCKCGFSS